MNSVVYRSTRSTDGVFLPCSVHAHLPDTEIRGETIDLAGQIEVRGRVTVPNGNVVKFAQGLPAVEEISSHFKR